MVAQGKLITPRTVNGANYNSVWKRAWGLSAWLPFLTQGRVRSPVAYNFGVSSTTLVDVISTQIPQLVALVASGNAKPTHAVIDSITNDIQPGGGSSTNRTDVQIKADLVTVWTTLRNMGIVPVQRLNMPRLLSTWTAGNASRGIQINRWITDTAPLYDVVVIDPWAALVDPASTTGQQLAGYFYDGLHPTPTGAYWADRALADYFNTLATRSPYRGYAYSDAFDATSSPTGNLMIRGGIMFGTGGPLVGTGASGVVADGITATQSAGGGTSLFSKVARTDGGLGWWQRAVLTGDTTGNCLRRIALPAGLVAGDKIVATADTVVSGASGLTSCDFRIGTYDAASGGNLLEERRNFATVNYNAADLAMPNAYTGKHVIDDVITLTGVEQSIDVRWSYQTTAGAAQIDIGAIEVRKVS